MTLQEFLVWIISGGGAAALAYGIMELIGKRADLSSELKRYLSLVVAAVLAAGAYALRVLFGYDPAPATFLGWLEAIFAVIGLAVTVSQAIHGRLKLRRRDD